MRRRPAVVLVHGFRDGAAHWADVIGQLHRCRCPARPFTELGFVVAWEKGRRIACSASHAPVGNPAFSRPSSTSAGSSGRW